MSVFSKSDNSLIFHGVGVSSGIAIGKIYVLDRRKVKSPRYFIKKSMVETEKEKFVHAIEISKEQLLSARAKISSEEGRDLIYILDAHIMILEDRMLVGGTLDKIEDEEINAEWGLEKVTTDVKKVFDRIDDEYLRERKSDIDYVADRVMRNLVRDRNVTIPAIEEDVIVVAHDLSPADTAQMAKEKVLGFATDIGGKTSHTAIMARALEIPAVVGLERITELAQDGDTIIVDGMNGLVILNPTSKHRKEYQQKKKQYAYSEKELFKLKDLPGETIDGYTIQLMANMELVDEITSVIEHGANGIGLYRTEFLYLNRSDIPTEEEHFKNYVEVVKRFSTFPTTIRTLDIGGDKFVSPINTAKEMNPALGLRAIRLCLKEVPIFKAQLRGILRASANGKLKIMIPMISGLEELRRAKEIFENVKEELRKERINFDEHVPFGIMIETPSACITADDLAKEADFFSIGTNDLIQYSLAIDRVNEHVAYLYEPLHPAILKMVKYVVEAGHRSNIHVGMCGEMAGEEKYILILLGLGLDELSMNPISIPRVKRIIRSVRYEEAKAITEHSLKLTTAREVEELIQQEMMKRFPKIFAPLEG